MKSEWTEIIACEWFRATGVAPAAGAAAHAQHVAIARIFIEASRCGLAKDDWIVSSDRAGAQQ